jgi:hypothetical protein
MNDDTTHTDQRMTRRDTMKTMNKVYQFANDFFSRYPAILSGYVIYAYLFVTIMNYYIKAKTLPLNFYDIFTIFSALPFMWFLSVALVKIIDVKTKLYESERLRILTQKELDIQQTQVQTMQETVRGLQHHINNPLTVIVLSMEAATKAAFENKEVVYSLGMAKKSVDQIQYALSGFSSSQNYRSEAIDSYQGKMASLRTMMQVH